jgi:hypothetical protein
MLGLSITIGVCAGAVLALRLYHSKQKTTGSEQEQGSMETVTLAPSYVRRQFRPIEAPVHPCGHGSAPVAQLAFDTSIPPDLAALTIWDVILDGEPVHSPLLSPLEDRFKRKLRTVADLEYIARTYPGSEWLLRLVEPLQSSVYQRHASGSWNLIKVGSGMF